MVIRCTETKGALTFTVRVVPRAARTEIAGEHDAQLRVRLAAPPIDGAANAELIRFLARLFDVPPKAVEIIAGHSAKTKIVRVVGAQAATLEKLVSGD